LASFVAYSSADSKGATPLCNGIGQTLNADKKTCKCIDGFIKSIDDNGVVTCSFTDKSCPPDNVFERVLKGNECVCKLDFKPKSEDQRNALIACEPMTDLEKKEQNDQILAAQTQAVEKSAAKEKEAAQKNAITEIVSVEVAAAETKQDVEDKAAQKIQDVKNKTNEKIQDVDNKTSETKQAIKSQVPHLNTADSQILTPEEKTTQTSASNTTTTETPIPNADKTKKWIETECKPNTPFHRKLDDKKHCVCEPSFKAKKGEENSYTACENGASVLALSVGAFGSMIALFALFL